MRILDFLKKAKQTREEKTDTQGQAPVVETSFTTGQVPKKEKPVRAKTLKPKVAEKVEKKEPAEKKEEKPREAAAPLSALGPEELERRREAKFGDAYRALILKSPAITEKATDLVELDQYVFKVSDRSNKTEIKKAIQSVYGVDVLAVRIINVPRKARMVGRQKGWKLGYKKAIIKIKKGQKIEVLAR